MRSVMMVKKRIFPHGLPSGADAFAHATPRMLQRHAFPLNGSLNRPGQLYDDRVPDHAEIPPGCASRRDPARSGFKTSDPVRESRWIAEFRFWF